VEILISPIGMHNDRYCTFRLGIPYLKNNTNYANKNKLAPSILNEILQYQSYEAWLQFVMQLTIRQLMSPSKMAGLTKNKIDIFFFHFLLEINNISKSYQLKLVEWFLRNRFSNEFDIWLNLQIPCAFSGIDKLTTTYWNSQLFCINV
jgi:hypothetical protein